MNLDGDDPTITVRVSRVATPAGTVEQSSVKTASGARVLPIPEHLVPILRRHALAQREMRLAAGNLWQGERDQHVAALEFGQPPSPRTVDRWWELALQRAGLPHRRLHASRHTAASLLNERGASPATIAAWLGHARRWESGTRGLRTQSQRRPQRCRCTVPTGDVTPKVQSRMRSWTSLWTRVWTRVWTSLWTRVWT